MAQSRKERSHHCSKTSHEISGDPDGVSDRLNPHGKEMVSDKQSKLVAKAVVKGKLEAETGGREEKGESENKKNIGRLMAVLLIKVILLKLKKKGGNPLAIDLVNSLVDLEMNKE